MKKYKKSKRRFGGKLETEKLLEGPFDTENHRYMQKKEILSHIADKERIETELKDKFNRYSKETELEQSRLDKEHQAKKNEKAQLSDQEFKKKLHDENIAEKHAKDTAQAAAAITASAVNTVGSVVSTAGVVTEKGIRTGGWFVDKLILGIKGLFFLIKFIIVDVVLWLLYVILVKIVIKFLELLFNNIIYPFFEHFFALIFAFLFVAVIILILIFGVSSVVKRSNNTNAEGDSLEGIKQCSTVFDDTLDINIYGLGQLSNSDKIDMNLNIPKPILAKYKPTFERQDTPEFTFYNIFTNPFGFFSIIKNNPVVKRTLNGVKSTLRYSKRSVDSLSGGNNQVTTFRREYPSGRSDNIINIDSSIFADKSKLTDKGIPSNNSVVNIARPKDVEWEMPVEDYYESDYTKIPDTLLTESKDKNNIKITDKKTIIFPWIKTNNFYTLSCSDAYFKNDPTQKAQILIDNPLSNTCTFDNISTAEKFVDDKKRYSDTTNLSTYVS
jgi:hypothetical protein